MGRFYSNGRQYRPTGYYNHDASPHLGVLNLLISLVVVICLWNVWTTVPSSSSSVPSSSSSSIQEAKIYQYPAKRMNAGGERRPSKRESSKTIGTEKQAYPQLFQLQTTSDGQNVIFLESSRTLQDPNQRKLQQQIHSDTEDGGVSSLSQPLSPAEDSSPQKNDLTQTPGRDLDSDSTDTATSNRRRRISGRIRSASLPSAYSATTASASGGIKVVRVRNGWFFAIAISASIVAAGFYARRALGKWEEWELRSKEDSLAFDVAYTSTFSTTDYGDYDCDYDYGSFGSCEAESDWSGDYLDRFDV